MRRFLIPIILLFVSVPAMAEEYRFDTEELEKKIWHLGGYFEARPGINSVDQNAAQSRLKYYGRHLDDPLVDVNGKLLLEGSLEKDGLKLFLQPSLDYSNTRLDNTLKLTWYEAWLQIKPDDTYKLLLGKRSLRWGKGYAWNPVAFFDRPKNPDDPELSLEGYWLATADFIRSFDGALKTLAVTPVMLPRNHDINQDFGTKDHLNWGGKLYALLFDTDIDLVALTQGSRSAGYGLDLSRNLSTNLEVHAELAWVVNNAKPVLSPTGQQTTELGDSISWLIGLRYLTERDTTYIVEYYRNGTGYTHPQMDLYFNQIDKAWSNWQQTGSSTQLQHLGQAQSYSRIAPMTDYLYARVSQKDPFDILYVTPALTTIINIHDSSLSVAPELLYTGITNWELRLKGTALVGASKTEFGEKQNDARIELRIRYFF